MDYLAQKQLATSAEFVDRVQQAIITAAINIGGEGASTKAPVDQARLSLVRQVLIDPRNWAQKFAFGIVTILANDTPEDGVIASSVGGVWNAFAGINPNLVPVDVVSTGALEEGIVTAETLANVAVAETEAPAEIKKLAWYTKWFGIGG